MFCPRRTLLNAHVYDRSLYINFFLFYHTLFSFGLLPRSSLSLLLLLATFRTWFFSPSLNHTSLRFSYLTIPSLCLEVLCVCTVKETGFMSSIFVHLNMILSANGVFWRLLSRGFHRLFAINIADSSWICIYPSGPCTIPVELHSPMVCLLRGRTF